MIIYGTRDGDLSGYTGNTGFRIYDRADRPRHMVTIYGANHNFFNETWDSDGSPNISRNQQENLAKVYMTAFFINYLYDQQAYTELMGLTKKWHMRGSTIVFEKSSNFSFSRTSGLIIFMKFLMIDITDRVYSR